MNFFLIDALDDVILLRVSGYVGEQRAGPARRIDFVQRMRIFGSFVVFETERLVHAQSGGSVGLLRVFDLQHLRRTS